MNIEQITEMALCEQWRVGLRPGQLYRFVVQEGCEACARQAAPYEGEPKMPAHVVTYAEACEVVNVMSQQLNESYREHAAREQEAVDLQRRVRDLERQVEALESKMCEETNRRQQLAYDILTSGRLG